MPSVKSSLKHPRVIRFPIARVEVDGEPAGDLMTQLARDYAWAASTMIRTWQQWHFEHGTPVAIHLREKTGPAFPAELKKQLYHAGTAAAPTINPTSIQWLNQWLIRTISQQTSAKHNRKRWCAVLHGDEAAPVFDYLPLRVYDTFASVGVDGQEAWVDAKLVKGADGKYRRLRIHLLRERVSNGKKPANYREKRQVLALVAQGKNRLPCSQLIYDRGRWYFALTTDRLFPQIDLRPGTTLFVRSSRRGAFCCRFAGRSVLVGGDRLLATGMARKKHLASRRRRSRWRQFCKTQNYHLAGEIGRAVEAHGVARVVILDGRIDSGLNVAGRDVAAGEPPTSTSYPMQQFRVFLRERLLPLGVEVVERANLRSVKRRISRGRRNLVRGQVQEAVV